MKDDELIAEARLDAKAFRENTVYDSEGDPIRLIANADRLDQYADRIEALTAEVDRLKLDLQAKDCLQDSAYQAGMKHGWNCAVSGDRDAYDTALSSEHIAELRRVNEARDACFAGCPECEPEGDAPEFFRMIDDLDDEGLFDEG